MSLFSQVSPLLAQTAPPNQRTHVVVILADDLGWGDAGAYGHPKFKTLNLDREAREGAQLAYFYRPTPDCALSRTSLLTDRYPHCNGITSNPAPDAAQTEFVTNRNKPGTEHAKVRTKSTESGRTKVLALQRGVPAFNKMKLL